MKKIMIYIAAIFLIAVLLFVIGPRPDDDMTISFDKTTLPGDLDRYLATTEKTIADLKPGLEKEIIWIDPKSKQKTPFSLVVIHGFSASKGEIRPVPDRIARQIGANLYFARLKGHGRSNQAMAEAKLSDWMNDYAQALAIGERLGEKIIVISVSTGGTLVKLGHAAPSLTDNIAGEIYISPNFKLKNSAAFLLTMPWAESFIPLVSGSERSFEPISKAQEYYWTTTYPVSALFPMASAVKIAQQHNEANISTPALFIYSRDDRVVDANQTQKIAQNWGGRSDQVEIKHSNDPSNHVLTGDIVSPSTNDQFIEIITNWIKELNSF